MLKRSWEWARRLLAGRRLALSIARNARAADDLDGVLREVLKR